MAPPRWIHCNLCYHAMAEGERKFYHLSCRHVLCKPCMAKTDRGKTCPICKQPLSRFTEMNNQMDRNEKMFYDPGVLKALSRASQSVIFQHKQRESLIGGILRCRKALPQLKEMETTLRERIVATQRQYEKFRSYRRNLQEILRQHSPGIGSGGRPSPLEIQTPVLPVVQQQRHQHQQQQQQSQVALSNRPSERDSRSQSLVPPLPLFTPGPSGMVTPTIRGTASSKESRQQEGFYHTASNNLYQAPGGVPRHGQSSANGDGGLFGNDSGISGMQTPASSSISRSLLARPPLPVTPATAARRHHPFYYNQLPSTITRRR